MDLKITFEDGSESLAHYGVKGMKWHKHLKRNFGYQDFVDAGNQAQSSDEFYNILGERLYESTAEPYVDSAIDSIKETKRRYDEYMNWEKNLTDAERDEIRKKNREKKRAEKKAARERIEHLLGL